MSGNDPELIREACQCQPVLISNSPRKSGRLARQSGQAEPNHIVRLGVPNADYPECRNPIHQTRMAGTAGLSAVPNPVGWVGLPTEPAEPSTPKKTSVKK